MTLPIKTEAERYANSLRADQAVRDAYRARTVTMDQRPLETACRVLSSLALLMADDDTQEGNPND